MTLVTLLVSLAALAISTVLFVLSRRASRSRQDLAQNLHDRSMALDRRCDILQGQLDVKLLQQRIDHLLNLLSLCERQERLEAEATRRLERYVLDLSDEARQSADAG